MPADDGYALGMVGLGVMGRNLLLNMSDHGHSVIGYDLDASKARALAEESGSAMVAVARSMADMIGRLRRPRVVMMLVPAGAPVDSVIGEVTPLLEAGDILIDGGNSHFLDTTRRSDQLRGAKVRYLGIGVSGGERGARHGPSLMPGGPADAYDVVQRLLEDVAARVGTDPCVAYLGPGAAGHYVKMVHNGIEYGVMQLIAETYDLMKRSLGLSNDAIRDAFRAWNDTELGSYLIEITAAILDTPDPDTGGLLIDQISDEVAQKGTGRWTSENALELGVPIPTIDMAVTARNISGERALRRLLAERIPGPDEPGGPQLSLASLGDALYSAVVLTYAQGFSLLHAAAREYGFSFQLEAVARIWRGGCIIRAALLEHVRAALRRQPAPSTLLLDDPLAAQVSERQPALRGACARAIWSGLPAPSLAASLAYFDAMRSASLPANLTAAQRDFFGAHGYRRIDRDSICHTVWEAPGARSR